MKAWIAGGIVAALLAGKASPAIAQTPPAAGGARPDEPEGVSAVLWPTVTPTSDGAGALRQPTARDGPLADRAREIDAALADAAQDLGLLIDVGGRSTQPPRSLRDIDLVEEARTSKTWVISPRIERDSSGLLIRIVAVPPGSKVALVRSERVAAEALSRRVVVMLRDLVQARPGVAPEPSASAGLVPRGEPGEPKGRARSPGRGVLSASLAVSGAYFGLALQRASRGDDPRLLYPLMALGTGVGLGAAMIVADEWDVGYGDAWYLTAGSFWSASAGWLLSSGYNVQPESDRHAFGLVAGIGGLGLASIVLSRKGISEGGAMLTHSGAALGGFVGGMSELIARGSTETTPYKGVGFGVAGGLLAAGAAATQIDLPTARWLALDLGAGLGALGGAAAASPLLLKDSTEARTRGWLSATLAGAAIGGVIGLVASRPTSDPGPSPKAPAATAISPLPVPGLIGMSQGKHGELTPAVGLSWSGAW
jgi:hypothetical protein